jgi:hypothetical protein
MKSEKAKAIIRESDFYFHIDGVTFQEARAMMKKDAIKAVELAEQEAEERMRQKAIEAYRRSCSCGESTCNSCALMRRFIQKLTE